MALRAQEPSCYQQECLAVFYKKNSGKQTLTDRDAVDEALCWVWIDSKMNPTEEARYRQVYTPPKSGQCLAHVK